MNKELKKEIFWAGFEFRVPRDWEINRHTLGFETGKLVLVDRRRQRVDLLWRTVTAQPDLRHHSRELQKRVKGESADGEMLELKTVPGWSGFWLRLDDTSSLTYAFKWHRESGRLVQATVVTRKDDPIGQNSLLRAILSSFRDIGWKSKPIRWKAFGLDCESPPDWELIETDIKPMNVKLTFLRSDRENKKKENGDGEIILQRFGMAGSWFDGDTQAFVRGKEPKLDFEFSRQEYRGHDAISAVARHENKLFHKLRGGGRFHQELLWLCKPANSLFRMVAEYEEKRPVRLQDFSVNCQPASVSE